LCLLFNRSWEDFKVFFEEVSEIGFLLLIAEYLYVSSAGLSIARLKSAWPIKNLKNSLAKPETQKSRSREHSSFLIAVAS